MTLASRITLLVFSASVVAVLALLGFLTLRTLRLERDELRAKADAVQQEALRLALWRMDSAVAPIIAQEAARPYFHYLSYYPEQRAFTRVWEPVRPGEVLVPSPLVEGTPPFVLLHFQVQADGRLTSPQVPQGNDRDLAESEPGGAERVQRYEERLAALSLLSLDARADSRDASASRRPIDPTPAAASPANERAANRSVAESSLQDVEREYGYRKEAAELASRPAPVSGQSAQALNFDQSPPPASDSDDMTSSLAASRLSSRGLVTDELKQEEPGRSLSVLPVDPDLDGGPALGLSQAMADAVPRTGEDRRRGNLIGLTSMREALAIPVSPFLRRPPSRFTPAAPSRPDLSQSAFVPRWRKAEKEDTPELLVWRSVRAHSSVTLQGFWIDWPALERHLLSRIEDVLPGASLKPVVDVERLDPALSSRLLASIPAMIVPPPPPPVSIPALTPSHITLLLTWAFTLIAVGAVGFSLRASLALSERRAKFVSAVTHELRTPLTTFVLYSQMLADGMVPEGEPRREYLATLKGEASRLQRIVENVLEFARLGRPASQRSVADAVSVRDLIDHAAPSLRQRALQAGMTLDISIDDDAQSASVRTSRDAVSRILTNLVDNACKYACDAADKQITIRVGSTSDRVLFRVRDRGPGVPAHERRRIFRAFARGRTHESSPAQGLGLGLSLARTIARQHGGDLRLDRATNGASFTLFLPRATRT